MTGAENKFRLQLAMPIRQTKDVYSPFPILGWQLVKRCSESLHKTYSKYSLAVNEYYPQHPWGKQIIGSFRVRWLLNCCSSHAVTACLLGRETGRSCIGYFTLLHFFSALLSSSSSPFYHHLHQQLNSMMSFGSWIRHTHSLSSFSLLRPRCRPKWKVPMPVAGTRKPRESRHQSQWVLFIDPN